MMEVPKEEWSQRQAERHHWYEVYRESDPQPLEWGGGFMFDGLVVAGWFGWYGQRPVLCGVEPAAPAVAEWVRTLEERSLVGPGRQRSRNRKPEDGQLNAVFPKNVSPRGEWERLRKVAEGEIAEQEEGSRRGSGSETSRRGRGERDRR